MQKLFGDRDSVTCRTLAAGWCDDLRKVAGNKFQNKLNVISALIIWFKYMYSRPFSIGVGEDKNIANPLYVLI